MFAFFSMTPPDNTDTPKGREKFPDCALVEGPTQAKRWLEWGSSKGGQNLNLTYRNSTKKPETPLPSRFYP
jgi:hypothetical protein